MPAPAAPATSHVAAGLPLQGAAGAFNDLLGISLKVGSVTWLNAGAARRCRGVIAAYNWAPHDALEKRGLALPFPQRDLHVKSWLGLTGADARAGLDERARGQATGG